MATKVSRYMTSQVISIPDHMGIREAFFLMKENSIRHLPIVDDNKQLIGIISDPEHKRFYPDTNEGMPAYAKSGDPLVDPLSERQVEILAEWLRGEWYEPDDGADAP